MLRVNYRYKNLYISIIWHHHSIFAVAATNAVITECRIKNVLILLKLFNILKNVRDLKILRLLFVVIFLNRSIMQMEATGKNKSHTTPSFFFKSNSQAFCHFMVNWNFVKCHHSHAHTRDWLSTIENVMWFRCRVRVIRIKSVHNRNNFKHNLWFNSMIWLQKHSNMD